MRTRPAGSRRRRQPHDSARWWPRRSGRLATVRECRSGCAASDEAAGTSAPGCGRSSPGHHLLTDRSRRRTRRRRTPPPAARPPLPAGAGSHLHGSPRSPPRGSTPAGAARPTSPPPPADRPRPGRPRPVNPERTPAPHSRCPARPGSSSYPLSNQRPPTVSDRESPVHTGHSANSTAGWPTPLSRVAAPGCSPQLVRSRTSPRPLSRSASVARRSDAPIDPAPGGRRTPAAVVVLRIPARR